MHASSGETHSSGPVDFGRMTQLCIMMFLQFFLWGSWYVTAAPYLGSVGFKPADIGWTYSVGPIAGIIAPFFVGMVADRFFATQRVLGLLHLVGAGVMYYVGRKLQSGSFTPSEVNGLFMLHMLCYYPTLALASSLAMHNIRNTEKEFPVVRVFGTIGWIAAGWVLSFVEWGNKAQMFDLACGAGVVLGLYCFTLPHTPPPAKNHPATLGAILGLDAISLLAKPSYLIFMFCSFLICIPLAFYYQLAATTVGQVGFGAQTPLVMSCGQISEILFMLLIPFFFVRLGVKYMLLVGMLAWAARYALFALGAPVPSGASTGMMPLVFLGVVLHGICYDFFFVTGQIYTDRVAPERIRGQAQGMLVLFTLGIGMLIGAYIAGQVEGKYTPASSNAAAAESAKLNSEVAAIEKDPAAPKERAAEIKAQADAKDLEAKQLKDWKMIWGIPCIMAAVITVGFFLTFYDDAAPEAKQDSPFATH